MRETIMARLASHRFTVTIPGHMAEQIEQACTRDGRKRSELFQAAIRLYLSGEASPPAFTEATPESEKDRLLEQWAQRIESDPAFEDIRAVSDAVDAIAGESQP
jgi:Arc/MetJ-type ribon-helix-helix transcriptional regulator